MTVLLSDSININKNFKFCCYRYDYHSISDAITMTSYLKKERNFAPVRAALRQLDYVVAMANNETVKNCVKVNVILHFF